MAWRSRRIRQLALHLLAVAIALAVVSCASPQRFNEFERTSISTTRGVLYVGMEPKPRVDEGGVVVWGAPYICNIQYYPSDDTVLFGDITKLEIRALNTSELLFSNSGIDDVFRANNLESQSSQKPLLGFGIKVPDFRYVDLNVSISYEIYKEKGIMFEGGTIETVLRRDQYEAQNRKGHGL